MGAGSTYVVRHPPPPQPTKSLDREQVWGSNHLAVERLAGANSGTLGLPF